MLRWLDRTPRLPAASYPTSELVGTVDNDFTEVKLFMKWISFLKGSVIDRDVVAPKTHKNKILNQWIIKRHQAEGLILSSISSKSISIMDNLDGDGVTLN